MTNDRPVRQWDDDGEQEALQFDVKDTLSSLLRDESWFVSCGLWHEHVLLTLPLHYPFHALTFQRARPASNREIPELTLVRILNRVRSALTQRFSNAQRGVQTSFPPMGEPQPVSSYRQTLAHAFHRVVRGRQHVDVYYTVSDNLRFINTHIPPAVTVPVGVGGSAIKRKGLMAGTVATLVNAPAAPAERALLTNEHVLQGCRAGDFLYDLLDFPIHQVGTYLGGLQDNVLVNGRPFYVDAALADPDPRVTADTGEILTVGVVGGVARPHTGMRVRKFGRTTGLTVGEVVETAFDPGVCSPPGQVNLIKVESDRPFQESGDSGSLLVTFGEDPPRIVGLMFAKGEDSRIGVACRWDAVADALNISL